MGANKVWSPSDTQKQFMGALKDYPNGATLLDLKLEKGLEFKTGSINSLITKGLVAVDSDKKNYDCDIVYNNQVIGHKTQPYTIYRLVQKD